MIIYDDSGDFQGRIEGNTFYRQGTTYQELFKFHKDILDVAISEGATMISSFDTDTGIEYRTTIIMFWEEGFSSGEQDEYILLDADWWVTQ